MPLSLASDMVYSLNDEAEEISDRIAREVKRSLPPGIVVVADISFTVGSLEFAGIVTVVNWMAVLGGAAQFTGILSRLVQAAVRRVLRRRFGRQGPPAMIEIQVHAGAVQPYPREESAYLHGWSTAWILGLAVMTVLLLAAILAVELYAVIR